MEIEGFRRRLGVAIRERRRAAGLTQEQLAERTGASTEWVSQVERGLGLPSLDLLLRAAEAVGAPVVEIVAAGADERTGREDVQELAAIASDLDRMKVRMLIAAARAGLRPEGP